MKNPRVAIWRQRPALLSTALGLLLLSIACFIYLRYASDPSNLHLRERIQHAQTLEWLWRVSLYGSILLFVISLFGKGRARWAALAINGATFLYALMALGAMCGPFGC